MNYYENLNPEVKEYFKILCPEFPKWLLEYIETPEMKRISTISMSCGTDYSKCFNVRYWYSNLDHSVGVALIIWNFTHNKKQTLAGLFHDIATPVFKHCIDFMNGDSENQESTEERTTDIIMNSEKIMNLLKRDGITLDEVNDYKKYPLADNEMPKLSADRFEYTFSSGLTFFRVWELDKIKKVYDDIIITKNEEGMDEFAFKNKNICEEYISSASKLWPEWISDKDRTVMQFLADMCKSMNNLGYLSIDDLYSLSEKEVIDKIRNCEDEYLKKSFENFELTKVCYATDKYIEDKYCVNVKTKRRFINPLISNNYLYGRAYDISQSSKEDIDNFLKIPNNGFTYFDFYFKPITEKHKKLNKKTKK